MGDRLATTGTGRKESRGLCPCLGGAGSLSNQCGRGRGLPPYQVVWPQYMGQKSGESCCAPFFGWGQSWVPI